MMYKLVAAASTLSLPNGEAHEGDRRTVSAVLVQAARCGMRVEEASAGTAADANARIENPDAFIVGLGNGAEVAEAFRRGKNIPDVIVENDCGVLATAGRYEATGWRLPRGGGNLLSVSVWATDTAAAQLEPVAAAANAAKEARLAGRRLARDQRVAPPVAELLATNPGPLAREKIEALRGELVKIFSENELGETLLGVACQEADKRLMAHVGLGAYLEFRAPDYVTDYGRRESAWLDWQGLARDAGQGDALQLQKKHPEIEKDALEAYRRRADVWARRGFAHHRPTG